MKYFKYYAFFLFFLLFLIFSINFLYAQKRVISLKEYKLEDCYSCHDKIEKLHSSGKHSKVYCDSCHKGLNEHFKDPSPETRPQTLLSWETCGVCHKVQYESFMKVSYHRPGRDEKSQLTGRSPNPFWDKLMMGHGFTKEHALTRSHPWMLVDHLIVDRAYGGRFQPKKDWQYLIEVGKAWDILEDKFPEVKENKPLIAQTAAAANPVCLSCKTQDHILDWAYLGDPDRGAKWSRKSNVVEFAKNLEYGLNCFICHDPHKAAPRIVRDALIDALTRADSDTLWHRDRNRTKFEVLELGERGYVRKIALLERYDSKLLCGQCHVEYTCNPGYDLKNPDKSKYTVTMDDRRTNHFPFKEVFDLYDHYVNKLNFLDFKHQLTEGLLWKAQHPETEAYYNSKHSKAGMECMDCHMPKVNEKNKIFTSHFAVTPKLILKDTCLKCHNRWTEEEVKYLIDSIKAYTKGKMRKAEFWISNLIDKIVDAKKIGLSEEVIKKAQEQHLKAHILWEFWTAENSDGFHNPEAARESLTKSIDEAQRGIKIIDEAMQVRKTF